MITSPKMSTNINHTKDARQLNVMDLNSIDHIILHSFDTDNSNLRAQSSSNPARITENKSIIDMLHPIEASKKKKVREHLNDKTVFVTFNLENENLQNHTPIKHDISNIFKNCLQCLVFPFIAIRYIRNKLHSRFIFCILSCILITISLLIIVLFSYSFLMNKWLHPWFNLAISMLIFAIYTILFIQDCRKDTADSKMGGFVLYCFAQTFMNALFSVIYGQIFYNLCFQLTIYLHTQ